jgi:hypothetical protein
MYLKYKVNIKNSIAFSIMWCVLKIPFFFALSYVQQLQWDWWDFFRLIKVLEEIQNFLIISFAVLCW